MGLPPPSKREIFQLVDEQRKHPRVSVSVSVTCELPDGSSVYGTAADLSMGGMFVESTDMPPFGSKLKIECMLPGAAAPLRFDGIVRWAKPGGFGVQFGLLGARETHALVTFIKRRA